MDKPLHIASLVVLARPELFEAVFDKPFDINAVITQVNRLLGNSRKD